MGLLTLLSRAGLGYIGCMDLMLRIAVSLLASQAWAIDTQARVPNKVVQAGACDKAALSRCRNLQPPADPPPLNIDYVQPAAVFYDPEPEKTPTQAVLDSMFDNAANRSAGPAAIQPSAFSMQRIAEAASSLPPVSYKVVATIQVQPPMPQMSNLSAAQQLRLAEYVKTNWHAAQGDIDSVFQTAAQLGMNPKHIFSFIRQESLFNRFARNIKSGASGLMQLMPGTAKMFGIVGDAIFDGAKNIFGGASYLKQMLAQFKSLDLAAMAYNAGPGNLINGRAWTFPETTNYAKKVVANVSELDRAVGL